MKIGDLKYILSLNPRNFLVNLGKARAEEEKVRKKSEKPMRLKADVRGLINGFATAGLAIDGVQRTIGLIRGPLTDVINLANQQEKAEQAVASALRSANQLTTENLNLLKQQASAIQQVTTSGDENNLMLQAQALNMGLAFDQIDDVTRGAIGLATSFATAGLNQETALKGIALAYQGNFTQLQRYIPALRDATSEAEKMEILQKNMADGFRQATEEAQTGAGQMKQLENAWGDLKEVGGELVKDVLVPIVQIARPTVEFFTNLTPATRNTGLAMTVLVASTLKAPAAFAALRTAVLALNASLGPAGWLILGISAAASALAVYQASASKIPGENILLATSNEDLADSYEKVRDAALDAAKAMSFEQLIEKRGEIQDFIREQEENLRKLVNAKEAQDAAEQFNTAMDRRFQTLTRVTQDDVNRVQEGINQARANLEAIEDSIQTSTEERAQKRQQQAQQQREMEAGELDKLREYQFETNRLSLADYIAYLQSRLTALRSTTDAESLEYLRLSDRIKELQSQLPAGEAGQLQIRPDTSGLEAAVAPLRQLFEIQTDFTEQTYADLEATYNARLFYANLNVQTAAEAYGEETDTYRQAVEQRWLLEQSFQNRKRDLLIAGAQATLNLSAQLMGAFQGESETLFAIGQAASIAQAIVNAHEAASKALAAYPPPFNIGAAALSYGLAMAQVKQIAAVKFDAPGGFAAGGLITERDLVKSVITPQGEDGIIAAQDGEFVMNRKATRQFLPLLVAMNRDQFTSPPGRAAGGPIGTPGPGPSPTPAFATSADIDRLIRAMKDNKPVIIAELDAMQFYRRTFRNYERLETARRID